jgi:hypothetical protein
MQEGPLGLALDPLNPAPATVIIHRDPASLLNVIEPILVLLEVDLNGVGLSDISSGKCKFKLQPTLTR